MPIVHERQPPACRSCRSTDGAENPINAVLREGMEKWKVGKLLARREMVLSHGKFRMSPLFSPWPFPLFVPRRSAAQTASS